MENNKELFEQYTKIMIEQVSQLMTEKLPVMIDERVGKIIDERVPKIIDERVPVIVNKIVDARATKMERNFNRKINQLKVMDETILDEIGRVHDIMDKRYEHLEEQFAAL